MRCKACNAILNGKEMDEELCPVCIEASEVGFADDDFSSQPNFKEVAEDEGKKQ